MDAQSLLLTLRDMQTALGSKVRLESSRDQAPGEAGQVLRAAAVDSAFRRFSGEINSDGAVHPVAASVMALVFDSPQKVNRTFDQVAQAAHIRTQVQQSDVAVETVTAPSGLVSYWGYLHRDRAMIIVTLDTLDPHRLSVADLRALVTVAARKLERLVP